MQARLGRSRHRATARGLWTALAATLAVITLSGCDATPPLIRGTVTTPSGEPAAGIRVMLYTDASARSPIATTTTDLAGEYSFSGSADLPDGTYLLRTEEQRVPEGPYWYSSITVTLTTGVTALEHVELFEEPARVSGTVLDSNGHPVEGAAVGAYRTATSSLVAVTVTAVDGAFSIGVFDTGTYEIKVLHQDHPLVTVGGLEPTSFEVGVGTTNIGTVDITTGTSTPQAFKALDAGFSHTCAIARDDTIRCWGSNHLGKASPPTGTYKAVTAGDDHSCAIAIDDTVVCWGGNEYGQSSPPVGEFKEVSAGLGFTCAISVDGSVRCWGGEGWQNQGEPPAGSFRNVSAGWDYTCAIAVDDTVMCWGSHNAPLIPPAGAFESVSAGQYHTCGTTTVDSVICWGEAGYGGELDPPAGNYTSVSNGPFSSCGVTTDAAVACWGPETVDPVGSYTAVSTGAAFACALAVNGTVTCWGFDNVGQSSPPSS